MNRKLNWIGLILMMLLMACKQPTQAPKEESKKQESKKDHTEEPILLAISGEDMTPRYTEKQITAMLDTLDEESLIRVALDNQLKQGSAYFMVGENTLLDAMASLPMIKRILDDSGYEPPSNFEKRVDHIFKDRPHYLRDSISVVSTIEDPDILYYGHHFEGDDPLIMLINYRDKFVTGFYFIPELIDYRAEYPDMLHLEDKEFWIEYDGHMEKMSRWKDLMDPSSDDPYYLDSLREKCRNEIYYRNEYLVYNSPEAFEWLIKNDRSFLNKMAEMFGYNKEQLEQRRQWDYVPY